MLVQYVSPAEDILHQKSVLSVKGELGRVPEGGQQPSSSEARRECAPAIQRSFCMHGPRGEGTKEGEGFAEAPGRLETKRPILYSQNQVKSLLP